MKMAIMKWFGRLALGSLLLSSPALNAAGNGGIDAVTRKGDDIFVVKGEQSEPMTEEIRLPNDIKVMTNGQYTVEGGKPRELKDGQRLGADGMLLSPNGEIVPVQDHITKKGTQVIIVRDGESSELQATVTLGSGMRLSPDGTIVEKSGRLRRLIDGELLKLSGTAIPAKDTITLQKGRVMVQKDGALFPVAPDTSLMMNDGTKVFGNGTVVRRDGSTFTLTEGQIVTIPGVVKTR